MRKCIEVRQENLYVDIRPSRVNYYNVEILAVRISDAPVREKDGCKEKKRCQ